MVQADLYVPSDFNQSLGDDRWSFCTRWPSDYPPAASSHGSCVAKRGATEKYVFIPSLPLGTGSTMKAPKQTSSQINKTKSLNSNCTFE